MKNVSAVLVSLLGGVRSLSAASGCGRSLAGCCGSRSLDRGSVVVHGETDCCVMKRAEKVTGSCCLGRCCVSLCCGRLTWAPPALESHLKAQVVVYRYREDALSCVSYTYVCNGKVTGKLEAIGR